MSDGTLAKLRVRIENFKRTTLKELLDQCTEPQRELFGRIFPGGVPEDKLESAIDLCDRTVRKNKAGRT